MPKKCKYVLQKLGNLQSVQGSGSREKRRWEMERRMNL